MKENHPEFMGNRRTPIRMKNSVDIPFIPHTKILLHPEKSSIGGTASIGIPLIYYGAGLRFSDSAA